MPKFTVSYHLFTKKTDYMKENVIYIEFLITSQLDEIAWKFAQHVQNHEKKNSIFSKIEF